MNTFVRWFGVAAIFGAITLGAIPASAQELSLGYQWQRISAEDESMSFPLGFNIDVAGPITPTLDIVGQLDWSRESESEVILGTSVDTSLNLTTFAGGIRWSSRTNPSATPFVQALFGATRGSFSCEVAGVDCDDLFDEGSSTDPMFQIGGGVVFPMGAWSPFGQFDYRRIFGDGEGVNGVRLVLGVRLGLR